MCWLVASAGYEQNWWSVVGIVLDIVGVSALFWELFLTNSRAGELSLAGLGGVDIKAVQNFQKDNFKSLQVMIRKDYSPLVRRFPKATREKLLDLTDPLAYVISLDVTEQAVSQHVRENVKRTRFRIFWFSAASILLGFILQIIGSWPC